MAQQFAPLGENHIMRRSMSNSYPFDKDASAHLLKQRFQTHFHRPSRSTHQSYSQGITTLMIRSVARRYTWAATLRRYVKSSKGITTMAAHLQGLEMNVVNYADTHAATQDDLHAPMVFVNGSRIAFQEAVKQICPSRLVQKSKYIASAYVDTDGASTCSNLDDVNKMAMFSSGSSGIWSTSTDKTDFACERMTVSMMLTHDAVNQNSQYLPQELAQSDALQKEAKPFMAARHKVSSECIRARRTDEWNSPGYREAWKKTNAQLTMLAKIYLKA